MQNLQGLIKFKKEKNLSLRLNSFKMQFFEEKPFMTASFYLDDTSSGKADPIMFFNNVIFTFKGDNYKIDFERSDIKSCDKVIEDLFFDAIVENEFAIAILNAICDFNKIYEKNEK